MDTTYYLNSDDQLTTMITCSGITTWHELMSFVKQLPYGRNANRTNLGLVISENKGTCSSKHALLKQVADLNGIADVKLMLGMYKMNHNNTPNIGDVLSDNAIDYLPEAHCYLKINGINTDLTSAESNFERLEKDLINEMEIRLDQVSEYKIAYHQAFLKRWLLQKNSTSTFSEIWKLRELCIANLSKTTQAE